MTLNPKQFGRGEQPEQLKMFMSANDILGRWGPLDADREGHDDYDYDYTKNPGSDDLTARTWQQHRTLRTTGGSKLYQRVTQPETDEELWQRKYEEAEDSGLADAIDEDGVRKPVSLGRTTNMNGALEVVGGHHRLAVMARDKPDELMPVLHHSSIYDAKSNSGYRYT